MTVLADEPPPPGASFPLGRVVITPVAAEWLPAEVIARALKRHQAGDWGDVGPGSEVARDNAEALRRGRAVHSFYSRPLDFLVVTSGDRATTTVRLSREFGS